MVNRVRFFQIAIISFIVLLVAVAAYYLQTLPPLQDGEEPEPMVYTYSYESGMQGWAADGTDLLAPPINWSVNRTQEIAYNGSYAVQMHLENLNDAGKIWMEHQYSVLPFTSYQVNISYRFGTADYGDVNLFTIIAGASATSPETMSDLTFQDDTGHHQETTGIVWLEKEFTYRVETNEDGRIVAFIGVWGTWETTRVYFVDDVTISIVER